ncbi:hypothetical protein BT96DRAFT_569184 [Gymnopus androsaceus JB14]|uniref:Uncharacterized protein n=1 Tax=Gymnopus androsaceus JB14 TaxID=1447944 RepID=A0A6A4HUZ3_9AGAR|nr:hypothetical protein BT96DRAFT_569184 [Gymnopus androsaceus JB14]
MRMIPTYNPTPLSLQFPDDDSAKNFFIAARGSTYSRGRGSGGGVENNARHVWFFWNNYPMEKGRAGLESVPFLAAAQETSCSSAARQILQLERHDSKYVYLEPNIVLPLASSPYPFSSEAAYRSASYYTSVYSGCEYEMGTGYEGHHHETNDDKGGNDSFLDRNPIHEGQSDQIYSLGNFSRDERELILALAADVDINEYLHGKGDQYERGNSWSQGFGMSVTKNGGGSSGSSTDGSDDSAVSESQSWQQFWYHPNGANGSNGSGMGQLVTVRTVYVSIFQIFDRVV